MSKIDKLSIQGIRAFNPSKPEAIQFNTPLTLIVGQNGSGKTTLIESLMYATTGELPPNSKGGAFVHDPSLTNDTVIPAQVKLAFFSTIGERLVVTRNIEVTLKKGNLRSFKTKDGSIKILHGTERTTISSKVAELDAALPRYLGVSPAVLEYVIFCHQDESLWPMSEPAALKKKFDQIFEAEKYTKAVDELKKVKKQQGEYYRKLKDAMDVDKANKERGEKAEKKAKALEREIEEWRAEADGLLVEMKKEKSAEDEKRTEAKKFVEIVEKLRADRVGYERDRQNLGEMEGSIELRTESDSWLENSLAEYEERVEQLRAQAEKKGARYAELQKELKLASDDLRKKNNEQGQHQEAKKNHDKQVTLRMKTIREAAARHEIRGYDGDVSDRQVVDFSKRIQKISEDRQRALDRLKKDNMNDNDEKQAAINGLDAEKSDHTQKRKLAREQTAGNDRKIKRLQQDVADLKFDPSVQVALESTLEDQESLFRKANDDFNKANFDDQIKQERDTNDQLANENDRLTRELVECSRLAREGAELDLQKKLFAEKKRKLESLKSTWNGKISAVLGGTWNANTVEAEFQKAIRREKSEVDEVRDLQRTKQDDLQRIDFKLSDLHEKLKQAEKDKKRCETAVMGGLNSTKATEEEDQVLVMADYLPRLDRFDAEIRQFEQDIALVDEMKDYWTKSQKVLDLGNKCSLCDRHFEGQTEEKARLKRKIEKHLSASLKAELEQSIDISDDKLNRLRAVRSSYDTHARMEKEIPSLQQKIRSEESTKAAAVRLLEQHDAAVKEAQDKLQDLEGLNKTVSDISTTHREIADAEVKIERLASQQSSGGQVRSVDEVQALQTACSEKFKASTIRLEKLGTEKQRKKDEINNWDGSIRDTKGEIQKAQAQSRTNTGLLDQIQSLKEENAKQRAAMAEADAALGALEPEIAEKRSAQQTALMEGRRKERSAGEEMNTVQDSVKELRRIQQDINDYLEGGGPARLAANEHQIAELEKNMAHLGKESELALAEANKVRSEVQNSDRTKRNIQDNLRYRKTLAAFRALEQEIRDLETRHAEEDHERLTAAADAHEEKYGTLRAQREGILGTMNAMDRELGQLINNWEQEYSGAARKYRETLIRHKTTGAAMADIGTYATALDSAIMSYHTRKMQEVNQIIGELWQTTYQGTDIDTILIRSDSEGAARRGNYNYRVCMVKQDTEMDMRGRCSAGQRVLASIIIRLALAESFGVNCGLVALDEPTTNLDEANIRSLAISLHAIIKARQAQSNFQLIIITHDEEFLRNMQCAEFCDTFYRVSRDEKQNSTITRQSINRLIEG